MLIRITDKSDRMWLTVNEYENNDCTDDSEDERKSTPRRDRPTRSLRTESKMKASSNEETCKRFQSDRESNSSFRPLGGHQRRHTSATVVTNRDTGSLNAESHSQTSMELPEGQATSSKGRDVSKLSDKYFFEYCTSNGYGSIDF